MIEEYGYINKESVENFLKGQGRLIELLKEIRLVAEARNESDVIDF